ncbi:hypothetical protein TNIN_240641 [Trichonephila inaurata madagascariensis]|uniref:Uncharacterized protein n=1 Tax=Trichonephila inaurata madagascariensis TaxID=2747483 RepID=A0A8X6MJN8_9ARAC|nr:hypothetical protein TNIN_240641 [Trichonephila inaurata madagascariensis]
MYISLKIHFLDFHLNFFSSTCKQFSGIVNVLIRIWIPWESGPKAINPQLCGNVGCISKLLSASITSDRPKEIGTLMYSFTMSRLYKQLEPIQRFLCHVRVQNIELSMK